MYYLKSVAERASSHAVSFAERTAVEKKERNEGKKKKIKVKKKRR